MNATDLLERHRVRILGNPEAPTTMVLAPGFGTTQAAWSHVAEAFEGRHRIVLFDHVGMAAAPGQESFAPERYSSLEAYAHDVLDLAAALELRGAVFVGHSVSGMIGVLAASKRPEVFSRLVLLGASPRYLDEPGYRGGFSRADLEALFAAMRADYHAWVAGFAPLAMGRRAATEVAEQFASSLRAIRPDVAQSVLRVIFESDHREDLQRVALPTLIVQASEDVAVPLEVGQYLERHLARGQLQVIEATGHLPHMSAPNEVVAAMRRWL